MTNRTALAAALAALLALPSAYAVAKTTKATKSKAVPSARAKTTKRASTDAAISLGRFVFANELSGRKPVAPAERFDSDGKRVFGYLEVRNSGAKQQLTMTWTRGTRSHSFRLTVGKSPRWRTWSYMRAVKANRGDWKVTVKDQSGAVLGEKQVTIGSATKAKAPAGKKAAQRTDANAEPVGC